MLAKVSDVWCLSVRLSVALKRFLTAEKLRLLDRRDNLDIWIHLNSFELRVSRRCSCALQPRSARTAAWAATRLEPWTPLTSGGARKEAFSQPTP